MRRLFFARARPICLALFSALSFPVLAAETGDLYVGPGRAGSAAVVDVRAAAEFQRVRIPGSVNFPLFSLKAKSSFLKDRDTVLVGGPADAARLEPEALALRARGFRVSILAGGLLGWRAAGLALEGPGAGEELVKKPLSAPYLAGLEHVCAIPGCTGHSCATCRP